MKPGRASRTAELVCTGRAFAHGNTSVARFDDPTASILLPEEARARVERLRSGEKPKGLWDRMRAGYLLRQSKVMVVRTVTIDDAIRGAAAPQVVILGAGLDGRAWRMSALRDVTVFEVDHPDSQRDKRARATKLTEVAHDIRFVPVDFERDDLGDALTAAGHDPTRPTTWIWEGVVMYLALADIEKSLGVIDRMSCAGSRLVIVYHSPALLLHLVGFVVGRLGEPLRSSFTEEAMRDLLARYHFAVTDDNDIAKLGKALSPDLEQPTKPITHLRIVVADRSRNGSLSS